MNVILNEVKNLLNDNTLSTVSLVGFEEMLRVAQQNTARTLTRSGESWV